MSNAMSKSERVKYAKLKRVIKAGQEVFVAVGKALAAIRDERLYREQYDTFETFCQREYGYERRYAYQLIEAAEVVDNVRHGAQIPPPGNERQARALADLPPAQQRSAWKEAVTTAPGGKVTAKHVESVVAKRREPMKSKPAPPPPEEEFGDPEFDDAPTREEADVAADMARDTFTDRARELTSTVEAQLELIESAARELNRILGRQRERGKPDFAHDLAWFFKPGHVDVFQEACDAVRNCLPAKPSDQHPGYLSVSQVRAEEAAANRKQRRAS